MGTLCRSLENQNRFHQYTFRDNIHKLPPQERSSVVSGRLTRCMLLPLTTAQPDVNIPNNCPVGHIPLGTLNVKMGVIDWVLCLYYCLCAIM